MCLKNKIIAAALCALVAGIGIFGITGNQSNVARAQTATTATASMSIDQLQQLVNSLIQQIQQLIQQIAYWKPLETCGNGICRFGETAANCTADCGNIGNCVSEGKPFSNYESYKQCCGGLTKIKYLEPGTMCSGSAACYTGYVCTNCGNGTCETGETAATCAADCGGSTCVTEGNTTGISPGASKCCSGLSAISVFAVCADATQSSTGLSSAPIKISSLGVSVCTKCGDGICGPGENKCNCPADCDKSISCAKENEIFANDTRQCCAGLTKKGSNMVQACQVGTACPEITYNTCNKITCGDGVCSPDESCLRDCSVANGQTLLRASGYGYKLGDIVAVKSTAAQKGDIVYYDSGKNNSMCQAMGSGADLAKIMGIPGDIVTFGSDYMTVGEVQIPLGIYLQYPAVFNGIKYTSLVGKSITLSQGEYLIDGIGQQCFAGDLINGSSRVYARFTVTQNAIIAVLGEKIGQDSEFINEMSRIVY